MKPDTRVGTCGFAKSHKDTFEDFRIVEVQQTFYQPPRAATVERWRKEAPDDFTFSLKAWQLLTHEASSPTYRRLREPLSDSELAQVGSFQWKRVTRMAWHRTLEVSEALQAEAIVFQTPRRFLPTRDNLRRIVGFFEAIDRRGRHLVFEPRGAAWTDRILRPVLADLTLVHGLDPFLHRPVNGGIRYFRLHGRPAYHYRYRYTGAELLALRGMLSGTWPNWVLFNNDRMADDAKRFIQLLSSSTAA